MTIVLNATTGITTPPVSVEGSTSGTITLVAPAVAGTNTQTLVAATGTLAPLIAGTAVASTSGTSIDFTSIPSWVKRITVIFSGVSTSGTSNKQIQLGTGSTTYTTTGYVGASGYATTAVSPSSVTTGFGLVTGGTAADTNSGLITIVNISGNNWVCSGTTSTNNATQPGLIYTNGQISLAAALTAVRITTVNGTDTFDAGSINILYE
jgi:hypothetical protein